MGTPASVPVGYRFHPTDEELVGHYLNHKLLGVYDDSEVNSIIAEVDICNVEPWDLPAFSKVKSDDPEWFFFCPIGYKYTKSNRCDRATKTGSWKITGKDRNIKKRGTSSVIGTKKTLVFYRGRAPRCVKTNWVIHEYHAVNFPDDKRKFVLCHLMEKAEKKAEKGTDALIHDEGESSNHITAEYENEAITDRTPDAYRSPEVNLEPIFTPQPSAEKYDYTFLEQPLVVIDQEPYFPVSTPPGVCLGNENNTMQFQFETTEEEDYVDWWNSILTEKDDFFSDETTHAFVDDTTPSQSSVYHESNETDAELISASASASHGKILDSTSMVKSSHDALYAASPPVSSQNETNLEKKDGIIDAAARRSQAHRMVSNEAVSQLEKEIHILESNKEQRKAQSTSSRKDVETTSDQSSWCQ